MNKEQVTEEKQTLRFEKALNAALLCVGSVLIIDGIKSSNFDMICGGGAALGFALVPCES